MDCIPNTLRIRQLSVVCICIKYTITGNCDEKTLRTVQEMLFYCSKTGHTQEQFENIFIKV